MSDNTFSTHEAAAITGATFRQINSWQRLGHVTPVGGVSGSGIRQRWTLDDLMVMAAVADFPIGAGRTRGAQVSTAEAFMLVRRSLEIRGGVRKSTSTGTASAPFWPNGSLTPDSWLAPDERPTLVPPRSSGAALHRRCDPRRPTPCRRRTARTRQANR